MTASTTMTIRVPTALKEKLGRLSEGTRRSQSFLAAAAVEAYVEREFAIIEGIQQGLADADAGRTVDHAVAMDRVDALIDETRRR